MNMISSTDKIVGERKIDVTRGARNGTVSSQWFSRPDDQRFLSLDDLFESVNARKEHSFENTVKVDDLRFHANMEDDETLTLLVNDNPIAPTNYSFGQVCSLVKAPAGYLRSLPAYLTALNLQIGAKLRGEDRPLKLYGETQNKTLRAATGPDFGRIFDSALVSAVQKIAGNGVDQSRWKVPGCINWQKGTYSPHVDVTKETTTLYASDRDVFMFLVDDTHPIEVGKLANGDPDLIFRGFYAANSEVGARALTIATFWLRGVCQNRNLYGTEEFDQLRVIHSKHGNLRFEREAAPALERYAASDPSRLLAGITASKQAIAAKDDDDRKKVLVTDLGFSMKAAMNIIETCEREEGVKPQSVWEFAQGITAVARTIPNTDTRLEMEKVAARFMGRAARNAT